MTFVVLVCLLPLGVAIGRFNNAAPPAVTWRYYYYWTGGRYGVIRLAGSVMKPLNRGDFWSINTQHCMVPALFNMSEKRGAI